MHRVRLIHWNKTEAADRAARIRSAGYRVAFDPPGPTTLRDLRRDPPDAIVIDLGRLPAQGRDVAMMLRSSKALRGVPLVFVEGDPAKVARIRKLLPDAVYATWRGIRGALKRAIARPPADPVRVESMMAGYSGVPLAKKLGVKEGSVVALVGAPPGFERTVGKLPDGAMLRRNARGRRDLTIWFTKSRKDLDRRIDAMAKVGGENGLWIAWPKQASGVPTDLTQNVVRRTGLDAGIVDHKICAIDATWSGLRFVRRRRR